MKEERLPFWLMAFLNAKTEKSNPKIFVERLQIPYEGKLVGARKLMISSEIPLPIEWVWHNVKTSDLLVFITRGYVKFRPLAGAFPKYWSEGKTVATRMSIFHILPFGGVHELFFETISDQHFTVQTRERDEGAKVWDHKIWLEKIDENSTQYQEEIVIYGGLMTNLITAFAKRFYQHRQRRWQVVAKERLRFFE